MLSARVLAIGLPGHIAGSGHCLEIGVSGNNRYLLLLQPGFTRRALYSSVPMGASGALLMLSAPCRPMQDGARRR
jgi:hypothetical protein